MINKNQFDSGIICKGMCLLCNTRSSCYQYLVINKEDELKVSSNNIILRY